MALIGMAGLVLGGCLPVSGGGYIRGAFGGKANFGFDVTCDTGGHLTGPWVYLDKDAGVEIGGDMSSLPNPCPSGNQNQLQQYDSLYTAKGHCATNCPFDGPCTTNCTGLASIGIYDGGGRGSMKGDCLEIILNFGPYDGYENLETAGTSCQGAHGLMPVLGGNLTVG